MKCLYVFRASAVIVDLSSFVLPPTFGLKNVAALIMHLEYLIENVSEHRPREAPAKLCPEVCIFEALKRPNPCP